jgi:hypothetical protein
MNQAYAADLLKTNNTVSELRAIAQEAGVSRKRGDTKGETAERIVAEAPDRLAIRDGRIEVVSGELGRLRSCDICGGPMFSNPSPLVGDARWECVDCDRTIRRQ